MRSSPASPPSQGWRRLAATMAAWLGFAPGVGAAPPMAAQVGNLGLEQREVRSKLQFSANYGFHRVTYLQYRVHHQGKPLPIVDARSKLPRVDFRDAWTLTGAPWPALLVHDDRWILISERDGQVRIEPLPSAPDPALQWVDFAPDGRQALSVGRVRTDPGQVELALQGGRFLLLDRSLLLDLQTLRTHRLALPSPAGYLLAPDPVLGVSPDGRAIAMLYRGESNSARDTLVAVVDTGTLTEASPSPPQLLPLDLQALTGKRQAEGGPLLLPQLFQWRPVPPGSPARPVLALRPQELRTPWRTEYLYGLRAPQGAHGVRMARFELRSTRASILAATQALLQQECGCRFMPATGVDGQPPGTLMLKIPTVTAYLRFDPERHALVIEASMAEAGLWAQSITRDLGEQVEGLLTNGRLTGHLLSESLRPDRGLPDSRR